MQQPRSKRASGSRADQVDVVRRNRSAFVTTETELSVIAAPAKTDESNIVNEGNYLEVS